MSTEQTVEPTQPIIPPIPDFAEDEAVLQDEFPGVPVRIGKGTFWVKEWDDEYEEFSQKVTMDTVDALRESGIDVRTMDMQDANYMGRMMMVLPADQRQAILDDTRHTQKMLLEKCIGKWDLKDGTGTDLPLTPENIAKLRQKVKGELARQINLRSGVTRQEAGFTPA